MASRLSKREVEAVKEMFWWLKATYNYRFTFVGLVSENPRVRRGLIRFFKTRDRLDTLRPRPLKEVEKHLYFDQFCKAYGDFLWEVQCVIPLARRNKKIWPVFRRKEFAR